MSKIILVELYDGVKASFSPNTYSRGNQAPPYALESIAGYLKKEDKDENMDVSIIHERAVSKDKAYLSAGIEIKEEDKKDIIQIGDQEILDMVKEKASQLKEGEPLIVGIRAVSILYNYALEISYKIKKEIPEARVVVGGYHASELKSEVYKSKKYNKKEDDLRKNVNDSQIQLVDTFVIGEGEKTFYELVKKISENNQDISKLQEELGFVDGLVFRNPKNNEVQTTNTRERFKTKNGETMKLPEAYREIIVPIYDDNGRFIRSTTVPSSTDCTQYATHPAADKIKGEIQISYSRGCPHDCPFCPSTGDLGLWGKKISIREPKEVVDEIVECKKKYGTNYVYFADLTFNYSVKKMNELFDEMKRYNKEKGETFGGNDTDNIHWFALAEAFNFTRGQDIDKIYEKINEIKLILARMKQMGCAKLGIGVEGIMPEEMLSFKGNIGTNKEHAHKDEKWSKDQTFEKAVDRAFNVLMSLKLANDEGIFTRGYFLLGMPGQDKQTNEIMKALLSQEVPEEFFDKPEDLKEFLNVLFIKMKKDRESEDITNEGFGKNDVADEIKVKINKLIKDEFPDQNSNERKVKLVGVDHIRIVPVAHYYGTQLAEKEKLNFFDCYRDLKSGNLYLDEDGRPFPKLFKNGQELMFEQDEEGKINYRLDSEKWTIDQAEQDKEITNNILGGEEGKTLHELVEEGFDDWELLDYFKTKNSTFLDGTIIKFPFSEKEIVNYVYGSQEYKKQMERMFEKNLYLREAIVSWENTLNKKGKEELEKHPEKTKIFNFAEDIKEKNKEIGEEEKLDYQRMKIK